MIKASAESLASRAKMSAIQALGQKCLQGFENLLSFLKTASPEFLDQIPLSTIENELGRLRIWCGSLGALQTGYASLDYRLRESTVMQTNILKLLQQLNTALTESMSMGIPFHLMITLMIDMKAGTAVVSGARLPFEQQPRPSDLSEGESTDESDLDNELGSENELSMRLSAIIDIHESLYQLSYKIRDPSLRPVSTKAASLRQIDEDTNVDLFDSFLEIDEKYLNELLYSLRRGRPSPDNSYNSLVKRLATSITLRRKYFKYWDKHAKKLNSGPNIIDTVHQMERIGLSNPPKVSYHPHGGQAQVTSGIEQQTIMSKTDATPYDSALDDKTEKGTIISYASTALDADGKGVDIPKPPATAREGKPFTCPYCAVLCPPKQGHKKAWKSHVLYDLQPYVCTYEECTRGGELYRSRKRWVEHEEMTHRCSWRCRDHPNVLYASLELFRNHLTTDHSASLQSDDIDEFARISAVSRADDRETCPICFEQQPFPKGLTNHLANHLERIALFSLPMTAPEFGDDVGQSQSSKRIVFGSQSSTGSLDLKGKGLDVESIGASFDPSDWVLPTVGLDEPSSDMLRKTLVALKKRLRKLSSRLDLRPMYAASLPDADRALIKTASSETHRCLELTEKLNQRRVHGDSKLISDSSEVIQGPLVNVESFLRLLYESVSFDTGVSLSDGTFSSTTMAQSIPILSALSTIGILPDILYGSLDILSGSFEIGMSKITQGQDILNEICPPPKFSKTQHIIRTMGDVEQLDHLCVGYQVQHSARFQPGEILQVLSPDTTQGTEGDGYASDETIYRDEYGGQIFVHYRRFILLANDLGHCQCVPISTHRGKGLKKRGIRAETHGIIYEKDKRPSLLDGEPEAGFPPVRVELFEHGERWPPVSRVNYEQLTTVEHHIKVLFIGRIMAADWKIVQDAVDTCWSNRTHYRRHRR
ncbi:hypothetical protein FDECE_12254 [Fusarium decemcellulare]|nr:hypothetical protein FDECE_12254 [Fusarium decemcellulare]